MLPIALLAIEKQPKRFQAAVETLVEGAVEMVGADHRRWSGSGSGVVSLSLLPIGRFSRASSSPSPVPRA